MESCHFCGDKKCEGCPVEYNPNKTVKDIFMGAGVTNNESFYLDSYKRGKGDVIIEIVWSS